jgi:hypothetical protein
LRGKWLKTVTLETPDSRATSATVTDSNPRSRKSFVATWEIRARVWGPPRTSVRGTEVLLSSRSPYWLCD